MAVDTEVQCWGLGSFLAGEMEADVILRVGCSVAGCALFKRRTCVVLFLMLETAHGFYPLPILVVVAPAISALEEQKD